MRVAHLHTHTIDFGFCNFTHISYGFSDLSVIQDVKMTYLTQEKNFVGVIAPA